MAYIIKPLVSEKANGITEKLNQFSFIVRPEANKLQIKAEVPVLLRPPEGESIDFYSNI